MADDRLMQSARLGEAQRRQWWRSRKSDPRETGPEIEALKALYGSAPAETPAPTETPAPAPANPASFSLFDGEFDRVVRT